MSREDVIRRIVHRELQEQGLTEEAVLGDAPELHQLACEHFGTWETALKYAGVDLRRLYAKRGYTRQQVVRRIREICQHGRSPAVTHVRRRDYRLYAAAREHFGTWREALLAAGIDLRHARLRTRKPRRIDKQKVLDALRAWSTSGHSMRWSDVCLENRALALAAKRAWHGWHRALVAAGLVEETQPPVPNQKWDRQRVIAAIRSRHREGKPMRSTDVRRDDNPLVCAAHRYFGTWAIALAAAGLGPQGRQRGRRGE
jgi:hypothetical protein